MSRSPARDLCWMFKLLWEKHPKNLGRDYTIVSRDMGEAKQFLAANGEVDVEKLKDRLGRFMESDFEAWAEQDYPGIRRKYPWGEFKRLYERQGGFCPLCGNVMPLIRGKIHMDHKDPNAKDFEDRSNRQVVCVSCNAKKSSRSIPEQAKHYDRTMRELLE